MSLPAGAGRMGALMVSALEGRWIKDEAAGDFLRPVSRAALAEDDPARARLPSGEAFLFVVDRLSEEGRFLPLDRGLYGRLWDCEGLGAGALRDELEANFSASLASLRLGPEDWIVRILALGTEARARILAEPRLGEARVPGSFFGFAYGGRKDSSLGALLRLWEEPVGAFPCPRCGARVFAYQCLGMLSRGQAWAWCPACEARVAEDSPGRAATLFGRMCQLRAEEREPRPATPGTALRRAAAAGGREGFGLASGPGLCFDRRL